MAKQLHFNKNGEALKRMQAGVDKLASVVGVTLGPKVGAASQNPAVGAATGMLLPASSLCGAWRSVAFRWATEG